MTNEKGLNELTDSDFQPLINDEFSFVENGTSTQTFELMDVSLLGQAPAADQRHAFSLLFRGPDTDAPQQQVFQLQHAGLGQLELFLVPVGSDESGMLYEAVFT